MILLVGSTHLFMRFKITNDFGLFRLKQLQSRFVPQRSLCQRSTCTPIQTIKRQQPAWHQQVIGALTAVVGLLVVSIAISLAPRRQTCCFWVWIDYLCISSFCSGLSPAILIGFDCRGCDSQVGTTPQIKTILTCTRQQEIMNDHGVSQNLNLPKIATGQNLRYLFHKTHPYFSNFEAADGLAVHRNTGVLTHVVRRPCLLGECAEVSLNFKQTFMEAEMPKVSLKEVLEERCLIKQVYAEESTSPPQGFRPSKATLGEVLQKLG